MKSRHKIKEERRRKKEKKEEELFGSDSYGQREGERRVNVI
jgi:hypothetical protein